MQQVAWSEVCEVWAPIPGEASMSATLKRRLGDAEKPVVLVF